MLVFRNKEQLILREKNTLKFCKHKNLKIISKKTTKTVFG